MTNTLYPLWGVLRLRAEQGETIAPNLFRLTLPKDPEPAPRHLSETEAAALEHRMCAYLTQDTPECRRDAACYYV